MKNILITTLFVTTLIFVSTIVVYAQVPQQPVKTTAQQPVSTQKITAEFTNPLEGVNSLSDLFYKIINFVVGLSYVVIAGFYLMAGFKFVKAQGNPEELSEAKRAFFNTTIGAVIIIGINVITQVIQSIINGLKQS